MRVLRPILIGSLISVLVLGAVAPSAGADPVTDAGIAWLEAQQRADGGFESVGFPGFETPDAILAIAADGQTTGAWSTAEALAAVQAVDNAGLTALDWIDAWVEGTLPNAFPPPAFVEPPDAGQRAKLIVEVALPLGLDPTDFDPAEDDAQGSGVDLTTGLDTIPRAAFNAFVFGRLAEAGMSQNVQQDELQVVCEAQHPNGGWSFDADPGGVDPDFDTTGFAVMALVAAGVPTTDPVLTGAASYVVTGQRVNGAWQTPPTFSLPVDDPNATALALVANAALASTADVDAAVAWLQSQQVTAPPEDAGRFHSPNDSAPPVSTFATTQSLQALFLALAPDAAWLPLAATPSNARRCLPESSYTDVSPTAWFDDGARWVDDADIVGGINGALRPNGNVNRSQAAMWLNEVFGGIGGDPHSFTDVPDGAWYEDGVNFVGDAPNGTIANGFGDEFRPRLNLNRAQAVSWLYAAAGAPDVSALPPHGFTDVGGLTWFRDAATWAAANEIVLGFADDTFRGNGNVRRAQLAQWMFNLVATPEAWPATAELPPTILFSEFSP